MYASVSCLKLPARPSLSSVLIGRTDQSIVRERVLNRHLGSGKIPRYVCVRRLCQVQLLRSMLPNHGEANNRALKARVSI